MEKAPWASVFAQDGALCVFNFRKINVDASSRCARNRHNRRGVARGSRRFDVLSTAQRIFLLMQPKCASASRKSCIWTRPGVSRSNAESIQHNDFSGPLGSQREQHGQRQLFVEESNAPVAQRDMRTAGMESVYALRVIAIDGAVGASGR